MCRAAPYCGVAPARGGYHTIRGEDATKAWNAALKAKMPAKLFPDKRYQAVEPIRSFIWLQGLV
jgi:hypothetical protein